MKVALIQMPNWGLKSPPFASAVLSAYLKKAGHDVYKRDLNIELYRACKNNRYSKKWRLNESFWGVPEEAERFFQDNRKVIDKAADDILQAKPALVGFTVLWSTLQPSLFFARKLKERNPKIYIAMGGPHCSKNVTGEWVASLPYVDFSIHGEGEETLLELIGGLEGKREPFNIKGIFCKCNGRVIYTGDRPQIQDIDSLPFADYDGYDLSLYEEPIMLPISCSRGCPNKCIYCDERAFWQGFRFRSGERIFSEAEYLIGRYGVKRFEFCDSLVNGNIDALTRSCELIIESGLKIEWMGQATVHHKMTREVLKKIKQSGCFHLCFGMEHASKPLLLKMGKILCRYADFDRLIRDCDETGLGTGLNWMFGFPGETDEDFQADLDFFTRNSPFMKNFSINPSPGFCGFAPECEVSKNPAQYGVILHSKASYWESVDGKNTYPKRLEKYQRFWKHLGSLGIVRTIPFLEEEKLKTEYYLAKRDFKRGVYHLIKSLIKENYPIEKFKDYLHRALSKINRGRKQKVFDNRRRIGKIPPIDNLTPEVSIVIPNYNGGELLAECLPSVLSALSRVPAGSEIIVVDDASKDDSVKLLSEQFPQVRTVSLKINKGFGNATNIGISYAKNRIIVLLNSDVVVREDFLFRLTGYFVDPEVFAVQPKILSWDRKSLNGGLNIPSMIGGYLSIENESDRPRPKYIESPGPTFYAIGGAMAFDKIKWGILGGFDSLYNPFCWEDIDISYRAWKRGWKVLYEPNSVVYHKHHETLKRFFTPKYRKIIESKNWLLFIWRNIHERRLILEHLEFLCHRLLKAVICRDFIFIRSFFKAVTQLIEVYGKRRVEFSFSVLSDSEIFEKINLFYNDFLKERFAAK